MRLLETTSLEFHAGDHASFRQEGYAVLSHRWVPHEVTLEQFGSHVEELKSASNLSPQLEKIRGACNTARGKGIKWIWIDSCCIDKRDLVETTESINAMYNWYHNSKLCIVYLYDVKKNDTTAITDPHIFDRIGPEGPSEWFSRGWTLQELLAPREMEFYDKEWAYMGTKTGMKAPIEAITGIDQSYLAGYDNFRQACIAQKMSWMVGRTTTREEDIAYSMVGLFGITMTPIYGEGRRAFKRLQEILLSNIAMDESLFAWRMPALHAGDRYNDATVGWDADEWGLCAPSPEWFTGSAGVRTFGPPAWQGEFIMGPTGMQAPIGRSPLNTEVALWYSASVIGLMLGIIPGIWPYIHTRNLVKKKSNEVYAFKLQCFQLDEDGRHERVEIYLRPTVRVKSLHHFTMFSNITGYTRVRCTEFGRNSKNVTERAVGFVPQPLLSDS